MPGAARPARGSFQAAGVVRDVDGVLAQRLHRHDLQRALVRRGQDHARRRRRPGRPAATGRRRRTSGRRAAGRGSRTPGRGVVRSLPSSRWSARNSAETTAHTVWLPEVLRAAAAASRRGRSRSPGRCRTARAGRPGRCARRPAPARSGRVGPVDPAGYSSSGTSPAAGAVRLAERGHQQPPGQVAGPTQDDQGPLHLSSPRSSPVRRFPLVHPGNRHREAGLTRGSPTVCTGNGLPPR